MVQVNIRIDDKLKEKADILFDEFGLNMTIAINMFIKASIRQKGIPYELKTHDNYFNDFIMKRLLESKEQIENGKSDIKTIEELELI